MSYLTDIIYYLNDILGALEGRELGKMVTFNQHGDISPFFQAACFFSIGSNYFAAFFGRKTKYRGEAAQPMDKFRLALEIAAG
jgi:hypothetical protein